MATLVEHACFEDDLTAAMLYAAAYASLLRVPSELLPCVKGVDEAASSALAPGVHSCLSMCGDELVLRLAR